MFGPFGCSWQLLACCLHFLTLKLSWCVAQIHQQRSPALQKRHFALRTHPTRPPTRRLVRGGAGAATHCSIDAAAAARTHAPTQPGHPPTHSVIHMRVRTGTWAATHRLMDAASPCAPSRAHPTRPSTHRQVCRGTGAPTHCSTDAAAAARPHAPTQPGHPRTALESEVTGPRRARPSHLSGAWR